MIARLVLSLALGLTLATAGETGRAVPGTSGAEEIGLPASALSAALSGASAGIVRDATAILDNPARLAAAGPAGMAGTYTSWPMDMRDSQIFCYAGGEKWGTLGIQARLVECSFTAVSENPDGSLGGAGGSFAYRVWQAGVAYAPDLSGVATGFAERISLGLAGFVVQRELDALTQRGAGLTAGLCADLGRNAFAYAACRNLGRLGSQGLPASGTVGAALSLDGLLAGNDRVAGAVEGTLERGGEGELGIGTEYRLEIFPTEVALRAGYRLSGESVRGRLPTGGLAIQWDNFALELAVADLGELGTAEVLTVSLQRESLAEAE